MSLRLPPAERLRLERASQVHGISLAGYIRRAMAAALDAEESVTDP